MADVAAEGINTDKKKLEGLMMCAGCWWGLISRLRVFFLVLFGLSGPFKLLSGRLVYMYFSFL
jgi:hypothetical protein